MYENYFFGYRVLYKNLDDFNLNWVIKENICCYLLLNVVEYKIFLFKSYMKYSFCVFVVLFKFVGFILEVIELRIDELSRWFIVKIIRV